MRLFWNVEYGRAIIPRIVQPEVQNVADWKLYSTTTEAEGYLRSTDRNVALALLYKIKSSATFNGFKTSRLSRADFDAIAEVEATPDCSGFRTLVPDVDDLDLLVEKPTCETFMDEDSSHDFFLHSGDSE